MTYCICYETFSNSIAAFELVCKDPYAGRYNLTFCICCDWENDKDSYMTLHAQ